MNAQPEELDRVFRRTQVVFWAFLAAPLAYIAAMFVLSGIGQEPVFDEGWTLYILVGILAVASAVQIAAREYMAKRTIRQARDRGQNVSEALAAAETMKMALTESIAVYGLFMFLLTAELWLALPFIFIGALALYASRPRKDRWREAAKEERT